MTHVNMNHHEMSRVPSLLASLKPMDYFIVLGVPVQVEDNPLFKMEDTISEFDYIPDILFCFTREGIYRIDTGHLERPPWGWEGEGMHYFQNSEPWSSMRVKVVQTVTVCWS